VKNTKMISRKMPLDLDLDESLVDELRIMAAFRKQTPEEMLADFFTSLARAGRTIDFLDWYRKNGLGEPDFRNPYFQMES
jgi:hypothetical protein